MRRIATIFVLIIFTVLLMTGCYYNIQADKDKQTVSTKTEKAVEKISVNVPYKQVHYTKVSKDFVYEFSNNDEGLPVGIQDDYKKYYNSAPGGFLVRETEKEYFICVSIGKRQSVKDGFKLQSVSLVYNGIEKEPVLKIEVNQIDNDSMADNYSYTGDVWAAALIRISKDSLPQGTKINSITMSCN